MSEPVKRMMLPVIKLPIWLYDAMAVSDPGVFEYRHGSRDSCISEQPSEVRPERYKIEFASTCAGRSGASSDQAESILKRAVGQISVLGGGGQHEQPSMHSELNAAMEHMCSGLDNLMKI